MADYGGANDGQCEFAFFKRCQKPAVTTVTYGQQNGWTYDYCSGHRAVILASHDDAREVPWT